MRPAPKSVTLTRSTSSLIAGRVAGGDPLDRAGHESFVWSHSIRRATVVHRHPARTCEPRSAALRGWRRRAIAAAQAGVAAGPSSPASRA